MRNPSLFDGQRATSKEAIELSAQSLAEYGQHYDHWQISFSGGKDSTTLVTLVLDLLDRGKIPKPKSLTVNYADTRLELPPLQASAMQVLREVERRGWTSQVVMAELDKRFMVYLLGRGVPPPNNNTMRWCTQKIKLDPMKAAMQKLYEKHGEKLLSLNGVRVGESAARDNRIAISCGKNGSECGQGWYQRDLPNAICDKLSPILHWRVCHVWDWLMLDAPALGFDTALLADAYGGDEAQEINARTGCIGCPLASRDLALEHLVNLPQWQHLTPLLEIRHLWKEARYFRNRLQKDGERKADGSYSAAPNRKGPLRLEYREQLLSQLLDIQRRCNEKAAPGYEIDLINQEEESRIRELIAARTFPNRWTGNEPTGDQIIDQIYADGSIQPALFK